MIKQLDTAKEREEKFITPLYLPKALPKRDLLAYANDTLLPFYPAKRQYDVQHVDDSGVLVELERFDVYNDAYFHYVALSGKPGRATIRRVQRTPIRNAGLNCLRCGTKLKRNSYVEGYGFDADNFFCTTYCKFEHIIELFRPSMLNVVNDLPKKFDFLNGRPLVYVLAYYGFATNYLYYADIGSVKEAEKAKSAYAIARKVNDQWRALAMNWQVRNNLKLKTMPADYKTGTVLDDYFELKSINKRDLIKKSRPLRKASTKRCVCCKRPLKAVTMGAEGCGYKGCSIFCTKRCMDDAWGLYVRSNPNLLRTFVKHKGVKIREDAFLTLHTEGDPPYSPELVDKPLPKDFWDENRLNNQDLETDDEVAADDSSGELLFGDI